MSLEPQQITNIYPHTPAEYAADRNYTGSIVCLWDAVPVKTVQALRPCVTEIQLSENVPTESIKALPAWVETVWVYSNVPPESRIALEGWREKNPRCHIQFLTWAFIPQLPSLSRELSSGDKENIALLKKYDALQEAHRRGEIKERTVQQREAAVQHKEKELRRREETVGKRERLLLEQEEAFKEEKKAQSRVKRRKISKDPDELIWKTVSFNDGGPSSSQPPTNGQKTAFNPFQEILFQPYSQNVAAPAVFTAVPPKQTVANWNSGRFFTHPDKLAVSFLLNEIAEIQPENARNQVVGNNYPHLG